MGRRDILNFIIYFLAKTQDKHFYTNLYHQALVDSSLYLYHHFLNHPFQVIYLV